MRERKINYCLVDGLAAKLFVVTLKVSRLRHADLGGTELGGTNRHANVGFVGHHVGHWIRLGTHSSVLYGTSRMGHVAAEDSEPTRTEDKPSSTSRDSKKVKAFFNLEEQAKRSRQRRNAQLRLFAERLRPLQDNPILGWRVVDDDGMPTIDAYVFL